MVVVEVPIKGEKSVTYYLEPKIKKIIDEKIVPSLNTKDEDCIIAIDGGERTGKSTLAFQIGKYVDQTLDLSRVVFNAEDFREAIFRAKRGQCIIFDEAFTGFSSRSSLSSINRTLVSLMMQMGQKNLMIIIVLPTFFLLDKYVALFRTRALFHVYKSGGRRGYYKIYSRKKKRDLFLNVKARQTYSYPKKIRPTIGRLRFYGGFALGSKVQEEKYRKKKEEALKDTKDNPMSAGQVKYREQRDIIIYLLRKNLKLTYQELSNMFLDYDLEISFQQVRNICAKFGDVEEKKYVRENKDPNKKVVNAAEGIKEQQTNQNKDISEDIEELLDESEEEQEEIE